MNLPALPGRPPAFHALIRSLALAAIALLAACASTGERTTTVIQPPTPPGLPKAPAIRVPNLRGVPPPPEVGSLVRVEREPPAAQAQLAPTGHPPFAGAVWQPGYYAWENNQYVWQEGRWAPPPHAGATWVAPRWEQRHNGYVFVEGYWR